jgi:hypothetical protein
MTNSASRSGSQARIGARTVHIVNLRTGQEPTVRLWDLAGAGDWQSDVCCPSPQLKLQLNGIFETSWTSNSERERNPPRSSTDPGDVRPVEAFVVEK